jgi:DNA-binding protein HU-beta
LDNAEAKVARSAASLRVSECGAADHDFYAIGICPPRIVRFVDREDEDIGAGRISEAQLASVGPIASTPLSGADDDDGLLAIQGAQGPHRVVEIHTQNIGRHPRYCQPVSRQKRVVGCQTVLEELGNAEKVKIGGLVQLMVRLKPATKARQGRNPATGEEITLAAKPASVDLRARPLAKAKTALPSVQKTRRRLAACWKSHRTADSLSAHPHPGGSPEMPAARVAGDHQDDGPPVPAPQVDSEQVTGCRIGAVVLSR